MMNEENSSQVLNGAVMCMYQVAMCTLLFGSLVPRHVRNRPGNEASYLGGCIYVEIRLLPMGKFWKLGDSILQLFLGELASTIYSPKNERLAIEACAKNRTPVTCFATINTDVQYVLLFFSTGGIF